jgi:hypothetical protein
MVYEAVPIDVEIQQLTPGQRDALSRYKIHENINTLFANEKVPALIAATAVLVSAPTILKIIFDALAKQDPKLDIDIAKAGVNYLTFTKDFAEGFFELSGAGTFITPGGSPFEGEAKDFWDKYVKK